MDDKTSHIYDQWLVLRCQEGDDKAFGELINRWQQKLWRHAHRMTGRSDVAWDVLQESWLAAVKGIGRLKDPARFRVWIYRIVTNKSTDWIRSQQRRRKHIQQNEEQVELAADQIQNTENSLEQKQDEVAQLRVALSKLPEDRRIVLQMHYLENLPIVEIAEILSIPTGTVKSRLHYARNMLRDSLTTKLNTEIKS